MRKTWLFLLVIPLLFAGCTFSDFEWWGYEWDGGPTVTSLQDAHDTVYNHMTHDGNSSEWNLPHESWETGEGDCEDYCILFMYLIYRDLGIESSLATYALHYADGRVASYHTIVLYGDGRWADPSTRSFERLKCMKTIVDEYNYGRTMYLAWIL